MYQKIYNLEKMLMRTRNMVLSKENQKLKEENKKLKRLVSKKMTKFEKDNVLLNRRLDKLEKGYDNLGEQP